MLNSCDFVGHLVADPRRYEFEDGNVKCHWRLAVGRNRNNKDGRDVDFFDFTSRAETAEYICKYFHKGDCMMVTNSRAKSVEYTTKDGQQRKKVEYDVGFKSDIELLYRKRSSDTENVALEQ